MSQIDAETMDFASGMAAFEAKHFSRAIRMLSPFADQGDPVAQHLCAIMHQNGLGVVRNELMAYKLMKASAEQGYGLAQHGMGFMYLEGECANKNGEEAAKWFRLAGAQGLQGSLTTLAPVSYTHLDVYKRQALNPASACGTGLATPITPPPAPY